MKLATLYGRYGYRKITALLRQEGWRVNHKRVERIWRKEGLKVPEKQPKRGRLWLNDGSCVRLSPAHKDHVWSYDLMMARTEDGRARIVDSNLTSGTINGGRSQLEGSCFQLSRANQNK